MQFNPGDKIILTSDCESAYKGMRGTIIKKSGFRYAVKIDDFNFTSGHSCEGLCDDPKGYYIDDDCMTLYKITNWKEIIKRLK